MYSRSAYGGMMGNLTIELNTKANMSPVSKEELISSTYSLLETLDILYKSSRGLCDCDVSCGAVDWSGSESERKLVEESKVWTYLEPMWSYAEEGMLSPSLSNTDIGDVIGDLVKWLSAVESISEHCGEINQVPIIKVLTKFLARIKLEFGINFDEGKEISFIAGLEDMAVFPSWLPQVDEQYLTTVEMALLAGTSNIRSVRNSQYDKDNPLHFFKEGKKVLVKTDVAKQWLNHRRGFVPTKLNKNETTVH